MYWVFPFIRYLELFLKASDAFLHLPAEFVDDNPEVACYYLCLSTRDELINGIVDKHVLGLWWGERVC